MHICMYLLGHGQSAYPWLGMHRLWPLKALGLPEEIAVVLPCPCGDRPNRRNHWFQRQPLFDEQKEPQPSYQSSPGKKKYFAKIMFWQKDQIPLIQDFWDPGSFLCYWQPKISAKVWIWLFMKPHKIWAHSDYVYFYFSKGEPLKNKNKKMFFKWSLLWEKTENKSLLKNLEMKAYWMSIKEAIWILCLAKQSICSLSHVGITQMIDGYQCSVGNTAMPTGWVSMNSPTAKLSANFQTREIC